MNKFDNTLYLNNKNLVQKRNNEIIDINIKINGIMSKHKINLDIIKSICKIKFSGMILSGHLIKFEHKNKPIYSLITSYCLNETIINSKETIEVYYDNDNQKVSITLDKEKRLIKIFTYIIIKITIVQILPEDNIEKNYFLLPNINYINNYDQLKNKATILFYFPFGENLNISSGKINKINLFSNLIYYSSITDKGSGGAPIFLEDSNLVLGIHIGYFKRKKYKLGFLIGPIVTSLKNNYEYSKKVYNNGVYKGEFKNNQRNGYGEMNYENGEYYFGQWLNDRRNGKGILYYYKHKIKYKGDFVSDKFEGMGKYIDENDNYYVGQFFNGLKHGKGTEYYKNDNIKYEGGFAFNKYDGDGKYIYENNNAYIGQFKDGKFHGKGIALSKESILIYEGDFDKIDPDKASKDIFC